MANQHIAHRPHPSKAAAKPQSAQTSATAPVTTKESATMTHFNRALALSSPAIRTQRSH